jgi:hypothetical protein
VGAGPTEGGAAQGGAIYAAAGQFYANHLTASKNSALGGEGATYIVPLSPPRKAPDGAGIGGTVLVLSNATFALKNSIVAHSPGGTNAFGMIVDQGNNISSDASCNFAAAGSLNNTDPVLGVFGDYGGPTPTIPLLRGSPAIDTADGSTCPPTDQRGISRPYGSGCDIGAFESAPPYTVAGVIRGNADPRGITISIDNASINAAASGYYKLAGLGPGQFVLTPSAAETRFAPGNRTMVLGPDVLDADFRAYRLNTLAAEGLTNQLIRIVYAGDPGASYVVERSTNLFDWSPSTNTADTNGLLEMIESSAGIGTPQYFRVRKP